MRQKHRDDLSAAFKALGNPHRLAIVHTLLTREAACCVGDRKADCTLDPASCNVAELGAPLAIDNSTLSHHLKELDRAGLIERARRGREIFCRANRRRVDELRRFLAANDSAA